MLHFSNLNRLEDRYSYLSSILWEKQFFFVGGLIRDLLLDRETKLDDIDVTMAGNPSDIKKIIHSSWSDFSYFETEKYGTMTIIPPSSPSVPLLPSSGERWPQDRISWKNLKIQFEITPFRTESTYSDGRHPDEVIWSNSLLADSERRDFTINSIYYTRINRNQTVSNKKNQQQTLTHSSHEKTHKVVLPHILKDLEKRGYYEDKNSSCLVLQNHQLIEQFQQNQDQLLEDLAIENSIHIIIDPHNGIQDLIDRKLQAVGDPDTRFQEDALRVIRWLRFAIALQCDFEKKTWTALQKNGHLIRTIAKERIKHECDKAFDGPNPFGFVSLLDSATILKRVFPKVYDNKWVDQVIRYHPFDVYTHTLLVLKHAQELSENRLFRYAALYHDVGKVEQYSSYNMTLWPDDVRDVFGSWLNHSVSGEDFVREDFKRLGASNKEIDTIARYVRYHMKPGEILRWSPDHYKKKLRKLIAEVWPEISKRLCLLSIADVLWQYNPLQNQDINELYILIDSIDEIMEEEGRFQLSDMEVDGNILMKELWLEPGPEVWRILKTLYEWVLENPERNNQEKLLEYTRIKLTNKL